MSMKHLPTSLVTYTQKCTYKIIDSNVHTQILTYIYQKTYIIIHIYTSKKLYYK